MYLNHSGLQLTLQIDKFDKQKWNPLGFKWQSKCLAGLTQTFQVMIEDSNQNHVDCEIIALLFAIKSRQHRPKRSGFHLEQ